MSTQLEGLQKDYMSPRRIRLFHCLLRYAVEQAQDGDPHWLKVICNYHKEGDDYEDEMKKLLEKAGLSNKLSKPELKSASEASSLFIRLGSLPETPLDKAHRIRMLAEQGERLKYAIEATVAITPLVAEHLEVKTKDRCGWVIHC